ncbi:MAG: hypothetical protein HQK66_13350 [Desulfamplus sp.]|nr:hypothetical protein [Desulfamplus sp.]
MENKEVSTDSLKKPLKGKATAAGRQAKAIKQGFMIVPSITNSRLNFCPGRNNNPRTN